MPGDVERQIAEPEHVLHLLGGDPLQDPRGDLDVLGAQTREHPLGVVVELSACLSSCWFIGERREHQHRRHAGILELGDEDGRLLLVLRRGLTRVEGHAVDELGALGDL